MRLYRVWVLVAVVATAAGVRAPLGAAGAGIEPAVLKRVASRVEPRIGVLTIEASAPVPYVTSQPDPKSFVVELRDVVTAGAVGGFTPDPRSPITSVTVDTATGIDGAAVARVRVALSQPGRPRVRSSRNLIIVEADRSDVAPSAGAIGLAGRSATIQDVRVSQVGQSTAVTIVGSGQLTPGSIRDAVDGRRRVVMEFANVSSAVPRPTTAGIGAVSQVRIGLSPSSPLVTEVAVDLSRPMKHRMEMSADGQNVTLVFDEPIVGGAQGAVAAQAVAPAVTAPASVEALQAPAPAAAPAPAQAPGGPTTPARYTGHPISLDFQGADLRSVL
ncbi:MAG TPA: hypothetical protein VIY56_00535, partial [Vicinamibacterales bacterium]